MKNTKKAAFLAAALAVLMLLSLTGCGQDPEPTAPLWQENEADAMAGAQVVTPYITLTYPSKWQEDMVLTQTTQGGNHVVTCLTELGGREVELFSLILGSDHAEGYLLGRLDEGRAGKINVICVMAALEESQWTAEEYSRLCDIQERVNDFLSQIQADPRFESDR